mgnify:CR=1
MGAADKRRMNRLAFTWSWELILVYIAAHLAALCSSTS